MKIEDNNTWNEEPEVTLDEDSIVGKLKCAVCDFTKNVTVKDMIHHAEHAFYDNEEAKQQDIAMSISISIGRKCIPKQEEIASALEADYHILTFEKEETKRTFELATLINYDRKNIETQEKKIIELQEMLREAELTKKMSDERIEKNIPEFTKRAGNDRIDAWI